MAVEDSGGGFNLYDFLPLVAGAGLSFFGGATSNPKPATTKTHTTTSTQYGGSPELLALLEQLTGYGADAAGYFAGEARPDALSLGALSRGVISSDLASQLRGGTISPEIRAAYDTAYGDSARLGIDTLTRTLSGTMGAAGLHGSTVGSGRTADAFANVLAQLGQQRASGLMQATQLSQGGAANLLSGLLQERGQTLGLRQVADQNLEKLMANPVMASLIQRMRDTATTTTDSLSQAKPAREGSGSVLGKLGGALIGYGLPLLL
jgi:hypothetical protein